MRHMEALQLGELGGRVMATRLRMQVDKPDNAELIYRAMDFDVEVPTGCYPVFTAVRAVSVIRLAWRNARNRARTF